jgi:uncharacterized SAM-binding protein YcdF (DUF218 family)
VFVFLSKFLPQFLYPFGLTCILLVLAVILRRKPRWQTTALLLSIGILFIGGNRWVSISLIHSLEWQYLPAEELPKAEAIVVLGGGTDSAQYPRQIVEVNGAGDRVLYAGWLYHQGAAPNLLLSGGYVAYLGERDAPANEMADLLLMLGVPEDALWLEPDSRNTYENALYSREILEREGIKRIILVTSALHMPRSVALFEKQGLEVIPAPADYAVTQASWESLWEPSMTNIVFNLMPSGNNLQNTTTALKEYIGIFVYRLRGWL